MASSACEGGSGGKIQRQLLRRLAATPYDRLPSPARGFRSISIVEGRGGGWLPKLMDPASRFITRTASRVFAYVFRKRLAAPPNASGSEEKHQVRLVAPEVVWTEQSVADCHNSIISEVDQISDLVQLLRQRSFTRAEVKHLTELISSRTLEPHKSESENNIQERVITPEETVVMRSSLCGNLSTSPANFTVLKRGTSVLDDGNGLSGSICRSPKKFTGVSPSIDALLRHSSIFGASSLQVDKDNMKTSTTTKKSASLKEIKYNDTGSKAANGDNLSLLPNAVQVSVQSSETRLRIFEQIDKLEPSPMKYYSAAIAKDESPSNFTTNILFGPALKNMENISCSEFRGKHTTLALDFSSDKYCKNLNDFRSVKGSKAMENVPLTTAVSGVAIIANGMNDASISNNSTRPIKADTNISSHAILLSQRKPSFQGSVSLDEERDVTNTCFQSSLRMDRPEAKFPARRTSASDLPAIGRHLVPSFKNKHAPSFISLSKTSMKASAGFYSSYKDGGFTFPVATGVINHSPPPPTPTMPNPSHAKLTQKEQTAAPVFSFSYRSADTTVSSSVAIVASESQG